MKKFLSLIVMTSVLVSSVSGLVFADVVEIVQPQKEGFVVYNDFETELPEFGFTDVTGSSANYEYEYDGEEHGNVLKVTSNKDVSHNIYTCLDEPVREGAFLVSFDIKLPDKTDRYMFMRFVSKDVGESANISHNDSFLTFGFKNGGFDFFPGMDVNNWWHVSGNPVKYTADNWHHIDIYADMYERKLYYYLDNVQYGIDTMKDSFDGIHGFYFTPYMGEIYDLYIDNWAFMKCDYENVRLILEQGHEAPARIKSPIKSELGEMPFGHNFFDGLNVPVNLKMENTATADTNTEVVWRVDDEFGQCVWSKKEELSIKAGEKIDKTVVAVPNAYGRLRFYAEFTDKATGIKSYFNTPIAVARQAQPNKRAAIHTLFANENRSGEEIKGIINTYKNGGFSARRTSYAWNHVETERGIIKIQGKPEIEINATTDENLEELITLSFGNSIYSGLAPNGAPGIMPSTDAELEAWGRYCYEITKLTSDRAKYYEVWNEPNLIPNFNPTGIDAAGYAKLVKVAYENVKKANPDAVVVGMSQSNYGTDFIGRVLDAGGGEYMDMISFHPYMWTQGPEAGQLDYIKTLREFVDEKGYAHIPFVVTEIGWQYTLGDDAQGIYTTQMLILNEVYGGLVDRFYLFRDSESVKSVAQGDDCFGMLDSIWREIPYMARNNFLGVANFNRLMNNVKFEETIPSATGLKLYHFTLSDGRDAIVTWDSTEQRKDLSLDLGTNEIVVSDMYGNENVYTSDDGGFTLNIDKFPHYIIGDFAKIEESVKQFSLSDTTVNVVGGSKAEFSVSSMTGDDYEVKAVPSAGIKIEEVTPLSGGVSKILVSAEDEFVTAESVSVTVERGGKVYYKARVDVKNIEPVSVNSYVEHHAGNRWRINLDITNNMYDGEIGGEVLVDSPYDFSKWISRRDVKPIKGNTTASVKIPIPDFLGTKDASFVGTLVMENGSKIDLSRTLSFKGIPYMRKTPTFDGVISDGEWNTEYVLKFGESVEGCNNVNLAGHPYNGDDDLRGTMYYGWDSKNFYLAAEMYDDMFEVGPAGQIWAGDSIQFAFSLDKTLNGKRTEITFGQSAKVNGPELERSSTLAPPTDGSRFIHEVNVVDYPQEDGSHKTVYEMSIPWAEMFPAGFRINDYSQVLFSVLVNDRDGNTRESYLEVGSGIGGKKTPLYHLEYNLMK